MQLPNAVELLALEVRATGVFPFLLTHLDCDLDISSWSKPYDKVSLESPVSLEFSSSLFLWLKERSLIEFKLEAFLVVPRYPGRLHSTGFCAVTHRTRRSYRLFVNLKRLPTNPLWI